MAHLHVLELPAAANLANSDGSWTIGTPLVAVSVLPWTHDILIENESGQWSQNISRPSIIGETLTALSSAPSGRWLPGATLEVEIIDGELESRPKAQILDGENMLAIETSLGWEIIQFATATLIGDRHYRLSDLLRGALGTDDMMVGTIAAGAICVMLDNTVNEISLSSERMTAGITLYYGPENVGRENYAWQNKDYILRSTGYICLSPVHIRAQIVEDDSLRISWVRRGRIDADNFELAEIPLGEASELYRIEVRADGVLVRTHDVAQTLWDYDTDMQAQDQTAHMTAQIWLVRIAQISATHGPGFAREFDISTYM